MSNLKKLFVAMLVMASMMVGGAAWACGPYGLSPEQQVHNQLLLVQSMIQHQQRQLVLAQQDKKPEEALRIQERLAQLEVRHILVQYELDSMRARPLQLSPTQLAKLQQLQQR